MIAKTIEGFRLSPQQNHLWRLQRGGGAEPFPARCSILIEGPVHVERLKVTLQSLVDQHEILRTTFRCLPGMDIPLQVIARHGTFGFREHDLASLAPAAQAGAVDKLSREAAGAFADVEQGPLLHTSLCILSPLRHVLLINMPALCADAVSLKNIVGEIARGYGTQPRHGGVDGGHVQYSDVAEIFNELLEAEETEAGIDYWHREDLFYLFTSSLPFENVAPAERTFSPRVIKRTLPAEATGRIESVAHRHGASVSAFLFSCWQALLKLLSGGSPVIVAVAFEGRNFEGLESAVGPYERYLPVFLRSTEDTSFARLLPEAKRLLAENYEWQDYFSCQQLRGAGADGEEPHPSFCFSYEEGLAGFSVGDLTFSLYEHAACNERFKLKLACLLYEECLSLELHFDPRLYTSAGAERLAGWFLALLDNVASDPGATLREIEFQSAAERQELRRFNDTRSDFPLDSCLHQLFEEQVEHTPDSLALRDEGRRLTYAEMNSRANQLAHYLSSLGVRPEVLVGVFMERSAETVVTLLGILKAGGAYVPLDPDYPPERLRWLLEDARPAVLLTRRRLVEKLFGHAGRVVCIDDDGDEFERESTANPRCQTSPLNSAYVIYTSGSTGRPKGVTINHRSLVNYLHWARDVYRAGAADGAVLHSTLSFDLTVTALFTPLLTGSCVQVIPSQLGPEALAQALGGGTNFGLLKITPSQLELLNYQLTPDGMADRTGVLVVGGENLLAEQIACWRAASHDTLIVNEFGPTEATVGCCFYRVGPGEHTLGAIPIGRPINNAQLFILDERLRPAPWGYTGNLYVGGVCLARGYLHKPAETAERFIPNPFSTTPGERLYCTGDLARLDDDGQLQFLGRLDRQVKIRGIRVELEEIEALLRQHPAVKEAAVLVEEDAAGHMQLVAYVVPDEQRAFTVRQMLQLDGGGLGANLSRYDLPNGMQIIHLNTGETAYLYQDIFEEQNYLKHGITIEEGDCVFDVGANIGLFTLYVGRRCRNAMIYAFEPIPPLFSALKLNTALYGVNVKPFACALSNESRLETFTYYPHNSLMSGRYADVTEEREVVKIFESNQPHPALVKAVLSDKKIDGLLAELLVTEHFICRLTTLSEVIDEQGVERIDLLKVDVEKGELDLLGGIEEDDWPKIKQIVVEVHDTDGRLEGVVALLQSHGFISTVGQAATLRETNLYNVYAVRESQQAAHPAQPPGFQLGDGEKIWQSLNVLSSDLQAFLQARLPEQILPAQLFMLEALPLTARGKVDHQALKLAGKRMVPSADVYLAPRNHIEEELAGIWSDVLGRERIGVHDNFFKLGGHSLQSLQLVSKISAALKLDVPVRLLFLHPTIADLAAALASAPAPYARTENEPAAGSQNLISAAPSVVSSIPRSDFLQIENHPLLSLFAAGRIPPVDAAAIGYLPDIIPQMTGLSREDIISEWLQGLPLFTGIVQTPLGRIAVITLPRFGSELYGDKGRLVATTIEAVEMAKRLGARVVSLTGLVPSATDYGRAVVAAGRADLPQVSTGHATTAAAVVLSIRRSIQEAGRHLRRERVGFLGLGSVGSASLRLMLTCLPHPAEIILCDIYQMRAHLQELRRELIETSGYKGMISLLESGMPVLPEFYRASLIVGATNVSDVLEVERLRPGTLIVDDSGPHCFNPEDALRRFHLHKDILFTEGGVLRSPQPMYKMIHLPLFAERFLDSPLARLYSRFNPFEITGCVLSGLLSAQFNELRPTLGLIKAADSVRHLNKLDELGFRAADLHCDGYVLEDEIIQDFRQGFGDSHRR